jgi:hypothetical protein
MILIQVLLLSYFSPQIGRTALHYVSLYGHPKVVQILSGWMGVASSYCLGGMCQYYASLAS